MKPNLSIKYISLVKNLMIIKLYFVFVEVPNIILTDLETLPLQIYLMLVTENPPLTAAGAKVIVWFLEYFVHNFSSLKRFFTHMHFYLILFYI